MPQRKLSVLILLVASATVRAQNFPKAEGSAGYWYLRTNPALASAASCSGGYASVAWNFNKWLGIVGDLDACRARANSTASSLSLGPQLTYRKCCRIAPFAHVLVGEVHTSPHFPGVVAASTALVLTAGGGIDVHPFCTCFGIRLAEVDYVLTRFNGTNQNNLQFKAGVVFQWW